MAAPVTEPLTAGELVALGASPRPTNARTPTSPPAPTPLRPYSPRRTTMPETQATSLQNSTDGVA